MKSRGSSKKSAARVGIRKSEHAARVPRPPELSVEDPVSYALLWLKDRSTAQDRENLARFGITAKKAFGVSMKNVQELAKRLGRSHELAAALWDTGWYEARMLTSFVDEVDRVTPSQMDRWCSDFDNWGICDTLCFHLFDRTPHAWSKVERWSSRRDEFVKRAAFALLASLALHDKASGDAPFLASLELVERASKDDRNFVKKGVNWALRSIGRRNDSLRSAAVVLSRRLAESTDGTARWIGKDALRDFSRKR
jgi:3-methyladenine DNA glycosylase AlkD